MEVIKFNEVCRICLGSADMDLFKIEIENMKLVHIFEMFTSLKIEEDDHLPHTICRGCMEEAFRCYKFRKKCLETHAILQHKLAGHVGQIVPFEVLDIKVEKFEMDDADENSLEGTSDHISNKGWDTAHTSFEIHNCYVCNVSFDSSKELTVHRNEATHPRGASTIVACPICSKPYVLKQMKRHVLSHSQQKPYVCHDCNKGFNAASSLRRHRLIHTDNGTKPFECEICGKGFNQAQSKKEHMRSHTAETSYVCKECGKHFRVWRNFKAHMMRECRRKISSDSSDVMPKRKYPCTLCGKFLASGYSLKTHLNSHAGYKPLVCPHCGKRFVFRSSYRTHLLVHTGVKPYVCTVCDKGFTRSTELSKHKMTHTGEKPHVCQLCKKGFRQRQHLRNHIMQVHSKEKPFVCTHCGKGFAVKASLTIHVRAHTGETPYTCAQCGKGFLSSSHMHQHRRAQHEN